MTKTVARDERRTLAPSNKGTKQTKSAPLPSGGVAFRAYARRWADVEMVNWCDP